MRPNSRKMDKIAGLKEILELDAKNSFARYGLAMELASSGDIAAALAEFDTLLANDPGYTAGYFMSAQTLATGWKPSAFKWTRSRTIHRRNCPWIFQRKTARSG